MKKIKVPFAPPSIDENCIEEVLDTLRSGWITTGPKTKRFEEELGCYLGGAKVVCVGSATQGMELILRWFGVGPGDEVIIPAYTYCATANVVLHCGAKPVMVDVSNDFLIDINQLEKHINPATKAIIPVDIGGYPCDYQKIIEVVKSKSSCFTPKTDEQEKLGRILVMGDSAHSFGAVYQDKMIGKVADIGVFSFHAVKNLTTAEGGAISLNLPPVFNEVEIGGELKTMSLHGQSKDAFSKTQKGGWRYDVQNPGYKCNMTDLQASLGLAQLKNYPETLNKREEIFDFYNNRLKQHHWAELPPTKNLSICSSFHVYMLRIKDINEQMRDDVIEFMSQQEVSVNVHFQPLPLLTAYKNLGYKIESYPKAFDNYSREISLPVFYDISKEQLEQVIVTLENAIKEVCEF